MTKEREILRRALEEFTHQAYRPQLVKLINDINALIAAKEGKQEELNLSCKSVQKRLAYQWGFVLPEQRKPLSDKEIIEYGESIGFNSLARMDLAIGVRWAERMHGISE